MTIRVESVSLDRTEARSSMFTEQQAFWEIPMHKTNIICDLAVTKVKEINVYEQSDQGLYSLPFLLHLLEALLYVKTTLFKF